VSQSFKTNYAIIAVVLSVLALSFGDAIIKLTGLALPLWQMYILRSMIALPMLLIITRFRKPTPMTSFFWVILRSLLLVVMWLCYYSSLNLVALSTAAAAYYTAPIFIALFATIASHKVPGLYVWFACTLGFFGVLLIVRPDETNFQWTIFLPILAAILYAVAMVLTSIKCKNDDPITLSITLNVAFIVSGILLALFSGSTDSYLFGQWQPLNSALIGTIAILAIVIVVGSVGAAIAYQNGPPATIAIFDYVYLLFSLIWGVLFFAHTPNITELVGILAIAAAGYTVISKTQTP